jgi:LmbE family N-acetylglucosaminyl deacetylase
MRRTHWCRGSIWAVAALVLASRVHAREPISAGEIEQQLRSFNTLGTVLHIAAHPDDENTQLITYLSRGRGYRTGYLSLTRGDGGQNELGRDFDERLGVARTQELLAARRLDGGRQFFTRAIDFGFSKSPEETLRFWDRDQVLADVVRVIRRFQPDVIVTRFPIPPGSGGHGHHTASAILAVEAFKIAGDPHAYPEQIKQGLTPWQPKRVLWNVFGPGRGTGGLNGPTVQLDIGGNDPVTGEAFGTIANRSRGMHKTQGLGGFSGREGGGPNVQTFMLLAGEPATNDVMDGVDASWTRVSGGAEIGRLAADVLHTFKTGNPAASLPALLALREKLAALPRSPLLDDKRAQLDRIVTACLGLSVETTVPSAEVSPGATLSLHHTASIRTSFPVRWVAVRYPADKSEVRAMISLSAGTDAIRDITRTLPANTPLTQPYWLREDGAAGIARVSDPALIGLPENPPAFPIEYVFEIAGQTLVVDDEPVQISGNSAQRLGVVAPVSLRFPAPVALFSPGSTQRVDVEVVSATAAAAGEINLELPEGWKAIPPISQHFELKAIGATQRVTFSVVAPSQMGTVKIGVVANVGGHLIRNSRSEVRYAHIPRQLLQPDAKLRASVLDVAVHAKKVGYLPGAGDSVAECVEQLGCAVTVLSESDLSAEKLRDFDAVILGVRAFNEHPDLVTNLPALLDYVEHGGTVIAQYNRPTNNLQGKALGPYPLSIQGPAPQLRVTDEKAPVTFLSPTHPALNTPNKIVGGDFDGWLQERGAYFPSSWDETHYTALLAMSDPGEDPLRSSLLIAKHGSGYFVYTGLSFFRQLPAGVPGAYRLFANLLSLGK